MVYWIKGVSLMLLLVSTSFAAAGQNLPGKVIAGWVENISFADNDIVIKAKLDTGAKTSSIFAEEIKKYKRDGQYWVDFTLVLQDKHEKIYKLPMSTPRARKVRIKNHDGDHDRRAVVEIEFCFDGRARKAEFTLANRSEYIYPVLLGRAFLKQVAIVDPGATFLTKATCQAPEALNTNAPQEPAGKANG